MARKFEHDGKTFEIREDIMGDRPIVRVFMDGKHVSGESVYNIEVAQDLKNAQGMFAFDVLADALEARIRGGNYPK